ncbi:MAG: PD40 domain-containing protein [Anaerolineaceae bacterium]|nr:PD40 domain-containing protein [Anaerolineaceae bacterium]
MKCRKINSQLVVTILFILLCGFPEIRNPLVFYTGINNILTENTTIFPASINDQDMVFAFNAQGWSVPYASTEIFVMRADGSGVKSISNSKGRDYHPEWSSDGKSIVFSASRGGNYEIYIMDADGQNQRRLTHHSSFDYGPTMSVNGNIAFISRRDDIEHIYIMDINGHNLHRLTNADDKEYDPEFSHDGKKIVYANRGDRGDGLILLDFETGQTIFFPGDYSDPSFSPADTRLAFVVKTGSKFCRRLIYTVNVDGTDKKLLTNNHLCYADDYDKHPVWSPDGQWILYCAQRDGLRISNLYKIRVDGTDDQQVTFFEKIPEMYQGPCDPNWFY